MTIIQTASQIIEGHGNNLLDKVGALPADLKGLSERRYALCKSCENFSLQSSCKLCGCYMPAKTKVIDATCPANKW